MATHDRRSDRAARVADRILGSLASELREARLSAGLSQARLAALSGVSHAEISRIERARARWLSVGSTCLLATYLGLDTSLRLYPAGPPIRDVAHARLLERLHGRLAPVLVWRTEVPLPIPGDPRAWDALIVGPEWQVAVEVETRLRDVQATARRIQLKARDGRVDQALLLVADTRANRQALRLADAHMAADFPLRRRELLAALQGGHNPGASGIVAL